MKGAPTNSWRKIVAKVTIIWAGGPTGDGADASGKDLDFNVSGIRDLNRTRAKLRAKNGRDVLHRSHLKQIECA